MSVSYTPLEMLSRSGIIGFDADAYLNGMDQPIVPAPILEHKVNSSLDYTVNNKNMEMDEYKPSNIAPKSPSTIKKIIAGAIALYLAGALVTRGKINNIFKGNFYKGMFNKICKFMGKIFK